MANLPSLQSVVGALCIFNYFYNTRPIDVFEAVYGPGRHPNYIEEKIQMMIESPWRFVGQLDNLHQGKLIMAAIQAGQEWAMGQANRVLVAILDDGPPPEPPSKA